MRKRIRWAAVFAAIAFGCGGKDGSVEGQPSRTMDEAQDGSAEGHLVQDVACAGCDVHADGTFLIGDQAERFEVTARKGTGPGFDGVGMAATGSVTMSGPFVFTGVVDTLVECDQTGGIRHARLEGPITSGGGGRFTVNVFDGRGTAPDQFWLFANYDTKPRDRFVEQNVRGVKIGKLNRCKEPRCDE